MLTEEEGPYVLQKKITKSMKLNSFDLSKWEEVEGRKKKPVVGIDLVKCYV